MAKKNRQKAFRIFQFQNYDTTHIYTLRTFSACTTSQVTRNTICDSNYLDCYILHLLFVLQKLNDG